MPEQRHHIILVPGFAGFDALGQLEYYSGVTPLIEGRPGVTLHFFDNFPTASVPVRAGRLMRYLAKRVARGEIADGDEVSLVGHSTGGLDIRRLIWDVGSRTKSITVDGGVAVDPDRILERVRCVVFLSVPHWGTNIADWVRGHPVWREAVVAELRAAVAGSQVPLLDRIEQSTAGAAASLTGSGLLHAVRDAVAEADERCGRRGPERTADAHEAASQLELYLRHIASDFGAIDDLTSTAPGGPPASPAHFDERERKRELKLWEERGIKVLSYVTLGRRVFRFEPDRPAPVWELTKPWTWPELVKDSEWSEGTDLVYRACYRACAGGPLERPAASGRITGHLGEDPGHEIELWDNDGIVNTVSMSWPSGDNVLVPGDHMDIVGHYRPVKAESGAGRTYQAYDLLGSASGFGPELFHRVWQDVFAFTTGGPPPLCE
jgi:triacylglycerol lipase